MKVEVYLDVWSHGGVSAWTNPEAFPSSIPDKTKGTKRYKLIVELPFTREVDAAVDGATVQVEPGKDDGVEPQIHSVNENMEVERA